MWGTISPTKPISTAMLTALLAMTAAAYGEPAAQSGEMQKAIDEFRLQTRNLGLRADSPTKQRGPGQSGNTEWGHRANRSTSRKRGGDGHAKMPPSGPPKLPCLGVILACIAASTAAGSITVAAIHTVT